MDCRDVRELADSFLAEQLLVETTHEVVRHLESCAACRAELEARRLLKGRLRAAFETADELAPRPEWTAALADSLRPSAAPMSRRALLRSWWALAAGVVLAGGTGIAVRESRERSRLAALARQAAGDHANCAVHFNLAESPISLDTAARRYGEPYGRLATFEPPVPAADVLARHSCVYDGRRFGHLVFRQDGAVMSFLITSGPRPASPELESIGGSIDVASLAAGPFVAFLVGPPTVPLLPLATAWASPLARHFA